MDSTGFFVFRLVLGIICTIEFFILIGKFVMYRKQWNTKTRDYWYALTMWAFATACANFESIIRGLPGRYTIILTIAAATVTLIGLRRRGSWGGEEK